MNYESDFLHELYDLLRRHEDPADDVTWDDITDYYNDATGEQVSKDTIRKGAFLLQRFGDFLQPTTGGEVYIPAVAEDSVADAREFQKERMKLQTEKLEYNRWLRQNARDDLLIEKLTDAIRNLPALPAHEVLPVAHNDRVGVLCFGDEHFGSEFEICGLHGEVINRYNVEIAEERMWTLLDKVVDIAKKEGLTEIDVLNMGDFTDGILRVGQLMKLQYGVVDSTVLYMEFLSQWLDTLTRYVRVKFQMVHGNHSQLRLLGQKKGAFQDENMGKIVAHFVKTRLADNPNFTYIENPTGLIFTDVAGFNLLGIHGECKNMGQALKDFSLTYKTRIDILVGGHLHHGAHEDVGRATRTIRVPSMIGADPYGMSLNATSDPGASFLLIERGVGVVDEKFIHVN